MSTYLNFELFIKQMQQKEKEREMGILTAAGFMHPPVKSDPNIWRASFKMLLIQVFMKKLAWMLLSIPSVMSTCNNVNNPSVSAPWWRLITSSGPRHISGKVARISLTPMIDPSTLMEVGHKYKVRFKGKPQKKISLQIISSKRAF